MRLTFSILLFLLFCTGNAVAQNTESDTLKFDDGSWYVGGIADSLFNGHGTMKYSDGTIYSGEWKDGLWNGKGNLRFPDGDHYSGSFKDHKMSGEGVYKYANGAEYNGHWENGMFNGVGTLMYEDGGYYAGEWKDDMRHGAGVLLSKQDTTLYKGYFENDIYIGKVKDQEMADSIAAAQASQDYSYYEVPEYDVLCMGISIGSKDMLVLDISAGNGYTFWGVTLSANIGKRTFGIPTDPYRGKDGVVVEDDEYPTVIGWDEFPDEEFTEGVYNGYNVLFNFGWFLDDFVQFGVNLGLGINTAYKNCLASESGPFERNKRYYKTRFDSVFMNYGTFIRYNIGFTESVFYNLIVGLNKAEGLYAGIGIQF